MVTGYSTRLNDSKSGAGTHRFYNPAEMHCVIIFYSRGPRWIIIIVLLTGITSLLVKSDRYTVSAKYKVTANVYERRVNLKRHVWGEVTDMVPF